MVKCEVKWIGLERKGRKDEEEREREGEGNLGERPRARERGGGESLEDLEGRHCFRKTRN